MEVFIAALKFGLHLKEIFQFFYSNPYSFNILIRGILSGHIGNLGLYDIPYLYDIMDADIFPLDDVLQKLGYFRFTDIVSYKCSATRPLPYI